MRQLTYVEAIREAHSQLLASDPRVFSNGHWIFDSSNESLHTLHHLGAGNFASASNILRARPIP